MSQMVSIVVLVEDTAGGKGLLAEHGLSYWIEIGDRRILFDTGQGLVLGHNAQQLDIALSDVRAVVLSHGHYDHAGGLGEFLIFYPSAKLYAHPAALEPKYVRRDDGGGREAGMSPLPEERERFRKGLSPTSDPTEIIPGLFVTGEIPRLTGYEDTGGAFFLDSECHRPDPLVDDQALFFRSKDGLVVLLGCAHSGVVNTLRYILNLTGEDRVAAVIGGMHLLEAGPQRLRNTLNAMEDMGVQTVYPAHCTGLAATAGLYQRFGDRCGLCQVSTRFSFSAE